jgi:hypothetical protein
MTTLATVHPWAFAAAAVCAARKDEVRTYLQGVRIEPREGGGVNLVGCDAHRLLNVVDLEGTVAAPITVALTPTLLTKAGSAKAIELAITDGTDAPEARLSLGSDTLYGAAVEYSQPYPDWRQLLRDIRTDQYAHEVTFNAEYLADLGKIAKILRTTYGAVRLIYGTNDRQPVRISFGPSRGYQRLEALGCIMPLKQPI